MSASIGPRLHRLITCVQPGQGCRPAGPPQLMGATSSGAGQAVGRRRAQEQPVPMAELPGIGCSGTADTRLSPRASQGSSARCEYNPAIWSASSNRCFRSADEGLVASMASRMRARCSLLSARWPAVAVAPAELMDKPWVAGRMLTARSTPPPRQTRHRSSPWSPTPQRRRTELSGTNRRHARTRRGKLTSLRTGPHSRRFLSVLQTPGADQSEPQILNG